MRAEAATRAAGGTATGRVAPDADDAAAGPWSRRHLWIAALVGIVHFGVAWLALRWHAQPGFAEFWPTAGLLAGVMIALGPAARPGLAVSGLLAVMSANLIVGRPLSSAVVFGLCDMTESLTVAMLADRLMGPSRSFARLRDLAGFIVAALGGTVVAALSAATLVKLALGAPDGFVELGFSWFEATFVGVCTFAPVVIMMPTLLHERVSLAALAEGALVLVALTIACAWLFGGFAPQTGVLRIFSGSTFLFPLVLWIAARAPPAFASAAVMIVALVVVFCTSNGLGRLGDPAIPIEVRLLAARITMLTFAGTVLAIATLFRERRQAEVSLRAANGDLSALSATLENRVAERTWDLRLANRELTRQAVERERVTAELRQSEAWHRAAQRIAGVGSFSLGPTPSLDQHWSDEARRITGHGPLPQGLTIEAFVATVVHCLDRERVLEALGIALATGNATSIEYRIVRADGVERTVLTAVEPAADSAGGTRLLCTALDVTERNAAEQKIAEHRGALIHMERVATAGELASQVAHEVNQPLSAISHTASALIRLDAAGRLQPAALTEHLTEISVQSQRASRIIRQIRQFVQKRPAAVRPLDVGAVIGDVLVLIGPLARHRGVRVEHRATPALPAISGVEIQLGQLLVNLMLNAIDVATECPPERRRVCVNAREEGDHVLIEVADSGPGIPEEVRARMFEPFFTTKKDGLGMGLPISKTIAEAHGGRLEICTAGGGAAGGAPGGTVLRAIFPAIRGPVAGARAIEASPAAKPARTSGAA